MVEFFEIFKNLKSNLITPKASVYQGTTQYGSRFHLGQDAEIVSIWPNFSSSEYLSFLDSLIEKRYPTLSSKINKDLIELMKIASFGNPRGFITLIFRFINESGHNVQVKMNKIIDERCNQLKDEYLSLSGKIPHYSSILNTGILFFNKTIEELKEANKEQTTEKCITLGLDEELNFQQQRMINFLIEAGLLYESDPIKHGDGRVYRRMIPHTLFILRNKVLTPSSKGFSADEILQKFNLPNTKHPKRKKIETMLTKDELDSLTLVLANCQKCNAKRISEKQKYCTECGAQLQNISTYKKCLAVSVNDLPLTEWLKTKILTETQIKQVQDFLTLADPGSELKKAYGIGNKKSEKIFETVIKYVKEYLS